MQGDFLGARFDAVNGSQNGKYCREQTAQGPVGHRYDQK